MKKAALYIRVSTSMQAEEGLSIPAQIKLLQQFAAQNGFTYGQNDIFIDAGESAKSADRPQFQKMIARAKLKPKPWDAILIHKTDRFARNRLDSAVYKSLLRKECGIDVISITERFSDDAYGVMMEGIMELFAEFYSLNLSAEVKKGMTEGAQKGIALGLPPYGYAIDVDSNKYCIYEPEAVVVKKIYDLYLNGGLGMKRIQAFLRSPDADKQYGEAVKYKTSKAVKRFKEGKKRKLGWSTQSIKIILRNITYTGVFKWTPRGEKPIYLADNHPAIIKAEDFDEVQKLIDKRRVKRLITRKSKDYLLRNLVKCLDCGGNMSQSRQVYKSYNKTLGEHEREYWALRCTRYAVNGTCYSNAIRMEKAEEILMNELKGIFEGKIEPDTLNIINNQSSTLSKDVSRLENKVLEYDDQFERQMKAYQAGIINIDQLKLYKEKLEDEKAGVIQELEKAKHNIETMKVDKDAFRAQIASVIKLLEDDNVSLYDKQKSLMKVIKEIQVSKKQKIVKIVYNF